MQNNQQLPFRPLMWGVIAALALLIIPMAAGNVVEVVDATRNVVVQSPISGDLTWYTTPGPKFQGFGKVTQYSKRTQYWFTASPEKGEAQDQSVTVRFNDGGHAQISGSVSIDMPADEKSLTALHTRYGSQAAVEQQLIRPAVEKSIYLVGPLMSSTESIASRRQDLLQYVEDQINNGVYRTESVQVRVEDPISGGEKTVTQVRLVHDSTGAIARQEASPLREFGIKAFNLAIDGMRYDSQVEAQVTAQQGALAAVQTALANAKKAEQDAITAQKNGEAEAAKAKWAQEALKATAVTQAEQALAVASLDKQTAEQRKQEQILLGQGEAERRKLVMTADGALEQKLKAYTEVNARYAQALENIKVPIVPSTVFGGNGASGSGLSGGQQFMDLIMAKTARDLSLDVSTQQK